MTIIIVDKFPRAAMKPNLFRKAALERLSSPERLDSLMEVVNLKAWIALAAGGLVLLAALAWGFLGGIADEVGGEGILAREGGYYHVNAGASGTLDQVLVHPRDQVVPGQVLAVIRREPLQREIRAAEALEAALARQRDELLPLLAREQKAEAASIEGKGSELRDTARAAKERMAYLSRRLENLQTALGKGLVTPDVVQNTRQELIEVQARFAGTESGAQELASREAMEEDKMAEKRFSLDLQLREVRDRLIRLRAQYESESKVVSEFEGEVLEVFNDPGEEVAEGAPLMKLELRARPAVCYLLVASGAAGVRPGMGVQMEPEGIHREEYGLMIGRVRSVSPAPLSLESIDGLVHNRQLAGSLAGKGDTFLVEVEPETDPATPSGFRWTSRQGPPQRFTSGVLLTGMIQVRKQAPITLVLPALKKWFRG
jgi:HlyD family secretion protein